ncbi:MAG: hypothetical protein ILP07_00970 [Treponema sp.]|nr:hypothetical protein [Treponema sp.]
MEHRLNIKKSLRNDYALSLPLVLALSGALILALIIFVFKEIDFTIFQRLSPSEFVRTFDFVYLAIFSVIILVGIFFFFKRWLYLKSFENAYQRVDAVITHVETYRDRMGLDTRYYYAAQGWNKHFALFKNHQTQDFEEDSEVILIIKPESPKSALILNLYFD